jgi:hypothetical protein
MRRRIIGTVAVPGLVAVLISGCAATDRRALGPPDRDRRSGFSGYGCTQVARQVEGASRGDYLEVREITDLQVVQDERRTSTPPRGDEPALVLRCTGSGQWTWGPGPVTLEVSLDRDGATRLDWEPTY